MNQIFYFSLYLDLEINYIIRETTIKVELELLELIKINEEEAKS